MIGGMRRIGETTHAQLHRVQVPTWFLVTMVLLASVEVGALAGFGYWFFSRSVESLLGLPQWDFIRAFEFGPFTYLLQGLVLTTVPVVLGAIAGGVMGAVAVLGYLAAKRISHLYLIRVVLVSLITLAGGLAACAWLYPLVSSPLLFPYVLVIGGTGLLPVLSLCLRPAPSARQG
jgi:hypothetical protein